MSSVLADYLRVAIEPLHRIAVAKDYLERTQDNPTCGFAPLHMIPEAPLIMAEAALGSQFYFELEYYE